jgi:hypothetical protein
LFLQEHTYCKKEIPGKLPLEKKEHGKEFLFFGKNRRKFPRIPGAGKQKKGMQKGMHNLGCIVLESGAHPQDPEFGICQPGLLCCTCSCHRNAGGLDIL